MTSKLAEMVADVRGEQIPVKTTAMVCSRCGFQALTEEQSDAYTIASADAYRRKHGLLTSQELKALRARVGMSQQSFAKFLKVGVASIKRWEAGLIQDEAMDELIRLKTDLETARANVRRLEERLGERPHTRAHVIVTIPVRREAESEWDMPGVSHRLLPGFLGSISA